MEVCSEGLGSPQQGPGLSTATCNCRPGISPLDCLVPSCHPGAQLRAWHQTGAQQMLAAQQVTLRVTHIPADSSSCFLAGRQLPWSERNARTLPGQKWASLSTDCQRADSSAVPGVRTGPSPSRPARPPLRGLPQPGSKGQCLLRLCSPLLFSRSVRASRAEVAEDRILPAPPSSVAC